MSALAAGILRLRKSAPGRSMAEIVAVAVTTGVPLGEADFDGSVAAQITCTPPRVEGMLEFNRVPGVGRMSDNGYAAVNGARAISDRN
jgi:hypothetical protein